MPLKTQNTNTTPQETQKKVSEKIVKKGKKEIQKKNKVLKRVTIVYAPINDIKPNTYNPNRQSEHDFELLLKSMEEDGFTQPIVCLEDLTIVDGEHRWRAAQVLGYEEIPVVKTNMTQEQMRISTLRHNRARGSEDIQLTADLLKDLESLGAIEWAQDSLMLDDVELNRLLDDIPAVDTYMGEEFEEAWVPTIEDETERSGGTTEAREIEDSQGVKIITGMSYDAIERQREQEKKLKQAVNDEEREIIRKESNFYRLSLMFSGDEAVIVKGTLGKHPAEKLIELCQLQNTEAIA